MLGIEKSASERLGIYEHIIDVMQLLIVARLSAMDIKDVGNIYFEFYDSLRLKELVSFDGIIPATNKWEHEILQTAFTDIPQIAEKLSVDFLNSVKNKGNYLALVKEEIKQIKSTSSYEAYDQAINDFCNGAKNISQFLLIVNMAKKI